MLLRMQVMTRHGRPSLAARSAVCEVRASWLPRAQKRGQPLRVQLYMEGQNFADVLSFNTIGDLPGSEKPEELVRPCDL